MSLPRLAFAWSNQPSPRGQWRPIVLLLALILGPAPIEAQSAWDVTQPRGKTREVDFVTTEGTWMSTDISPDGNWVLFDLLGHIYRVPVAGGDAECLTQSSGMAINFHPRYSPDGQSIAFISDRSGQMNLWTMNAEGSSPRPVILDNESRFTEPTWTPDGRFIVAVRNFPTVVGLWRRSARLWMLPREGGKGVELLGAPSGSQAYWPSVAPDGKSLYYFYATFAAVTTGYGFDQHIRRFDLATGSTSAVTALASPRDATWTYHGPDPFELAPEVSPNGRWLAFARRLPGGVVEYKGHKLAARTALWLKDLTTGPERVLMDPITPDMATTHQMKNFSVLPHYAWAKDSKSLVITQGGKLRRVFVESGEVKTIPFRARVRRVISEPTRSTFRVNTGPLEPKFMRWPAASADGKRLVFESVGRLWLQEMPNGTPKRLTTIEPEVREMTPAWSADGRWVAFVTFDDGVGGHVWKVPSAGGQAIQLTREPAEYMSPIWSSDGESLLVVRRSGAIVGDGVTGLVRIPGAGGSAKLVGAMGGRPHAGPGGRVYSVEQRRSSGANPQWTLEQGLTIPERWATLVSLDPVTGEQRDELILPYAADAAPSPDGRWLAYQSSGEIHLAAMPNARAARSPIRLDQDAGELPIRRLSLEGGLYPRWRDSVTVEFLSGRRYFAFNTRTGRTDTVEMRLTVPRDTAVGTVALTGARIVTLKDRRVLERGTVVVKGSRIACVGQCSTAGADRVVDVKGNTIIPGLVDTHAHGLDDDEYVGQHHSPTALYLAYGVTTILDPAAASTSAFPIAELIEAGKLVGPRSFSTGEAQNGSPPSPPGGVTVPRLVTREDVDRMVNRQAAWGAISIKQFLVPLRQHRQWIVEAARRNGLSVTAEGAELEYIASMIMDGQTGWEHPLPYAPIYDDAIQFFGRTGAAYSNTLIVASGGPWMEEYYRARSDLWNDAKQRRFVPWQRLARSADYSMRPIEGFRFPWLAEGFAGIVRAGGHGSLGGHGEEHGIDTHWELWGEATALTPMEALEVGSLGGAYMAGLERDIGSIEVGKLADLIVLNANPLTDIKRTTDIRFVMKAGRLYDGNTLDEIWPRARPYGPIPWNDPDGLRGVVVPDQRP